MTYCWRKSSPSPSPRSWRDLSLAILVTIDRWVPDISYLFEQAPNLQPAQLAVLCSSRVRFGGEVVPTPFFGSQFCRQNFNRTPRQHGRLRRLSDLPLYRQSQSFCGQLTYHCRASTVYTVHLIFQCIGKLNQFLKRRNSERFKMMKVK